MNQTGKSRFVSRGGDKLAAAMEAFSLCPAGWVCADLGANVGGFTDCLLQSGATRVYAVDTGYGTLAWRLRKDPRVVVLERTNAMHVRLPEAVELVAIDVGWTRQEHILPAAVSLLKPKGIIVSLIKPHYEAEPDELAGGVLDPQIARAVLARVSGRIATLSIHVLQTLESPIRGQKGNVEFLMLLKPAASDGAT